MINRIYSILSAGDLTATRFSRAVSVNAYRPSGARSQESRILAFPGSDAGYRQYVAGALADICFRSMLGAEAKAFDPQNTYGSWIAPTTVEDTISDLPAGMTVELTEPDYRHDWADMTAAVSVNPAFSEITVDGVARAYTVTGNRSAPVPLFPGILLSLRGVAASQFAFTISCARIPLVDLEELRVSLDKASPGWAGAHRDYKDNAVTTDDWLAAFVLSYCGTEGLVDG